MPSLKQRIDVAVEALVEDILELVRATSLEELEGLGSRSSMPREAAPRPKARRPRRTKKKKAGPSTAAARPAAAHPARTRQEAAGEEFDVTSPELLLASEPQERPTKAPAVEPIPPPARASGAPAIPQTPPLRPGESVARASEAGVVIKRTKPDAPRA